VNVFLPNDTGGAGAAAPLVDITVQQDDRYGREQQGPGSGLTFPKLFAKARFHVTAAELGGESRTTKADGVFATGETDPDCSAYVRGRSDRPRSLIFAPPLVS
jgi:hypothetical protein